MINKDFLDTLYALKHEAKIEVSSNLKMLGGPCSPPCETCKHDFETDIKKDGNNARAILQTAENLITEYLKLHSK